MLYFWEKISNIGVEQISDPSEKYIVRLTNVFLLLSMLLIFCYSVFFQVFAPSEFSTLVITLLIFIIFLLTGFYFNKIGSPYIARHILCCGDFLVLAATVGIYLGKGPDIHYYFIIYIVGSIIVWGLNRPVEIAFYFLLFMSSFVYFEYFQALDAHIMTLPQNLVKPLGITSVMLTYFIIGIVILLFEQFVRKSNLQLNDKNKSLSEVINAMEGKSREIEKQNFSLEEMNSIKDKFFSIIAHDLINPVGANKKALEILNENYQQLSEDDKLMIIKDLKESSQKVFSLLENLLEWSRSQSGKINFAPENYHVRPVIENQFSLFKLQVEEKSLLLQNKVPYSTIGYFDLNMMTTIIRNLISNAIKFTPENGTIAVNASLANDFLTVTVEDTGIGIESSRLEMLFKLSTYTITSGTKFEKGTSLGLILCKEFVEKHKGKIWVESETGRGSKFIFSLPLEKTSRPATI